MYIIIIIIVLCVQVLFICAVTTACPANGRGSASETGVSPGLSPVHADYVPHEVSRDPQER